MGEIKRRLGKIKEIKGKIVGDKKKHENIRER